LGWFWELVHLLGLGWLAFDIVACSFRLHCFWFSPQMVSVLRGFNLSLWCLSIYGILQYFRQLKYRACWGFLSVCSLTALLIYSIMCCIWWLLFECEGLINSYSEWSWPSFLDLREWPAWHDNTDLEAPCVERPAGVSSPLPAVVGKSGTQVPRPEALGPRRRKRHVIRVFRRQELIHVGRTRRGVKRWVRRHIQDARDITVEDSTLSHVGNGGFTVPAVATEREHESLMLHGLGVAAGSAGGVALEPQRIGAAAAALDACSS